MRHARTPFTARHWRILKREPLLLALQIAMNRFHFSIFTFTTLGLGYIMPSRRPRAQH